MKAFKCDKCGALIAGNPSISGPQLERQLAGHRWARKLDTVTVAIHITPRGDPTGYGGMELCPPCIEELAREITGALPSKTRKT
jgi:hypothetical protein